MWWSGEVPSNTVSGYDPNSEKFFGRSLLDLIERGKDNATLQNIRATNRMLEEELEQVKKDVAKRDEARKQAQSYKKRNNINWR